jgi:hypothetical protein
MEKFENLRRFVLIKNGSPGTSASSTIKTGRYDIAEILLKVALKHQKPKNQRLSLATHF